MAKTVTGGEIVYWAIVSVTALVRIVAVFQGMRRETSGCLIADSLATLACVDVWFYFANMVLMLRRAI